MPTIVDISFHSPFATLPLTNAQVSALSAPPWRPSGAMNGPSARWMPFTPAASICAATVFMSACQLQLQTPTRSGATDVEVNEQQPAANASAATNRDLIYLLISR